MVSYASTVSGVELKLNRVAKLVCLVWILYIYQYRRATAAKRCPELRGFLFGIYDIFEANLLWLVSLWAFRLRSFVKYCPNTKDCLEKTV